MDAVQLIPTPDRIQVPWGWFQVLLSGTFFFHLLVMNILLGCSLITFFHHAAGKSSEMNRDIARKLPLAVAFTVNFGVAPYLFLQVLYGHFMYASSVLMAVYWLAVFGLVMLAYYGAYLYSLRYERVAAFHGPLSAVIAFCFLAVAFIMTNNMSLMTNIEVWPSYFANPQGTILNLSDPRLLPRFLHSVLGAVAVAGLAIALFYQWQMRHGAKRGDLEGLGVGMNWFFWATMLNVAIGLWYWQSLPPSVLAGQGSGSVLFQVFMVIGTVSAFGAMIQGRRHRVNAAALLLLLSLASMVLVREFARRLTLAPWFTTGDLVLVPQYSPLITFLLVFGAGLLLIAFMIRLVLRERGERQ